MKTASCKCWTIVGCCVNPGGAEDGARPVGILKILTAAERWLVRYEWKDTQAPFRCDTLVH